MFNRIKGNYMSIVLPILAVTALSATALQISAQDSEAAKNEIIALETELGRAMIHRDTATLQRIVADEWICQGATGISTKASFISDVEQRKLVVTKFVLHDIRVRVFGDVAYLIGADDETSSYAGTDNSGTYNWLDVWTKRDGHWVSVATQITKAAPSGQK
jgi:ketosteroid isomerase-like protein